MTILELELQKTELLNKAKELAAKKKKLYSNMDIESPMSIEEKELYRQTADAFSKVDTIVRKINKMKRLANDKS